MTDKEKEALKDRLSSMGFFDENSYLSYQKAWQDACDYKQKEIDEYKEAANSEAAFVNELQAENANLKERIFMKSTLVDSLKAENSSLIELAKMVENNSLMPHKHDDYYTRLCCLSERARQVLKELEEK